MVKGTQSTVNTKQHCITFIRKYTNKSLEELWLKDYVTNRKGSQAGLSTIFGTAQATGGIFGQPAQPSTGLSGQPKTSQSSTGLFGTTNIGLSDGAFGQPSALDQTTQSNSLFGNKSFGTATTQAGFGF